MPSPALSPLGLPFVGAAATSASTAMGDSSSGGGFAQMLNQAQGRSPQPTPVPVPRTPSPQPAKPAPSPQTQKAKEPETKSDVEGEQALERQRQHRALQQRSAAGERPGQSAPVTPGALNPAGAAPSNPGDKAPTIDPVECPIDELADETTKPGAEFAAWLNPQPTPMLPPDPAAAAAAATPRGNLPLAEDSAKAAGAGADRGAQTLSAGIGAGTGRKDAADATQAANDARAAGRAATEAAAETESRDEQPSCAAELKAVAKPGAADTAPTGPLHNSSAATAPAGPGGSTASGSVAEGRMHAAPGSAEFSKELGVQLSTFVRDGIHHAKLELNPADMGPVTVQIQIDGQAAQVNLAAESAETRRALEQAMPELAGSLREAGLTLSGGGVSEQPRQQQADPSASDGNNRGSRGDRDGGPEAGRPEDRIAAPTPARRRGVVDLVA